MSRATLIAVLLFITNKQVISNKTIKVAIVVVNRLFVVCFSCS